MTDLHDLLFHDRREEEYNVKRGEKFKNPSPEFRPVIDTICLNCGQWYGQHLHPENFCPDVIREESMKIFEIGDEVILKQEGAVCNLERSWGVEVGDRGVIDSLPIVDRDHYNYWVRVRGKRCCLDDTNLVPLSEKVEVMDRFWECRVEGSDGGKHYHHWTEPSAKIEAERLAGLPSNQGKDVYIFECVGKCRAEQQPIKWEIPR